MLTTIVIVAVAFVAFVYFALCRISHGLDETGEFDRADHE